MFLKASMNEYSLIGFIINFQKRNNGKKTSFNLLNNCS